MRRIRKYACLFLIALLAFLWLRELTQRRAFEAARYYIYPLEDIAPYGYSVFSFTGIRRANGNLTGPVWRVCFANEPFTVAVSVFGNIKGSNFQLLDDVMGLSDEDRYKTLKE